MCRGQQDAEAGWGRDTMVSLSCLGTIPPWGLPAASRALRVWVAASWSESHVLRPWSGSKTKTRSKIWAPKSPGAS